MNSSGGRRSEERRRAPRIVEQVGVTLTEDAQEQFVQTTDLSTSGARCLMDRFIPPMTKLHLRLELPEAGKVTGVECTGVVVRTEPIVTTGRGRYHIAIFFTDLPDRSRTVISAFVRRRLASAS